MDLYKNVLSGKKVLVMGLGRHGGGAGSMIFAIKSGATEILCTDLKDEETNKPSIEKINFFIKENNLSPKIKYVFGEHRESDFLWADVIIKNPAVRFTNKFIQIAINAQKQIESEMTLFLNQKNPESQIIGVTGSKGKSSTTYMLYHILNKAYESEKFHKEIKLGGNMGISMLDNFDPDFKGIYVVELSSFVTEEIYRNNQTLTYYLITTLFPDHLNYYIDLEDYYQSKICLVQNIDLQKVFVNNANPDIRSHFEKRKVQKIDCLDYSRLDFPKDFNEVLKQNAILVADFLLKEFSISYYFISDTLKSYIAPKGRYEYLGNVAGVDFINDTCASIPEAAILAIKMTLKKNKKVFLITGGSDKGIDLPLFIDVINKNTEKVFVIKGGNLSDKFMSLLDSQKSMECADIYDAIKKSFTEAKKTDNNVVLLSRGCTSFGIANNEFEMGEDFEKEFEKIKNENNET